MSVGLDGAVAVRTGKYGTGRGKAYEHFNSKTEGADS
jgi:hypothetical protein